MKLENKLAVVTGGAQGIGRGLAIRFAQDNARHVAVVDLDGSGAKVIAEQINEAGGNASAHRVDVGDRADLIGCIERIENDHGVIDLFCSNAGIGVGGGLMTTDETWDRVWRVNVQSHIWAAQALVPKMIENGGGTLLSTASAAGLLTNIAAFPYAVTKHAAVATAEWLSVTYGDQGIHVACLCPMGVETNLLEQSGELKALLSPGALTVEQVVDVTIAGLADERFLILPHPEVAKFVRNKATDPDRWLASMRSLQATLDLGPK